MSLNANEVGTKNFKIIPAMEAGTYPARLRGIANLGLQNQRAFQGEEKPPAQELALTWEFIDEFLLDDDDQPDESKPRNLSETMPFHSLGSERAKSTQRYLALDPHKSFGGEWAALLSAPAMVTVTQSPGKDGRVWNNVAAVSAMRSSQAKKLGDLVNPSYSFDFYNPDPIEWGKLPNFLKRKAQESLEFKGSELEKMLGETVAGVEVPTDEELNLGDLDDEIPF